MILIEPMLVLAARVFLGRDLDDLATKVTSAYSTYCGTLKPSLSSNLATALVVAEDHRFFKHRGIDWLGILRVLLHFVLGRSLAGASTIEQQLVRTLTGRKERTFSRKAREVMLASWLSEFIPRDDIPGLYLSLAYFGWNMNGLSDACDRLGLQYSRMTQRQAAALVARLKYPEPQLVSSKRSAQIDARTRYIVWRLKSEARADKLSQFEALKRATILHQ